jgi:hypothetical protein
MVEAALAAQVAERIGRLSDALQQLNRRARCTEICVESPNRDVALSVDPDGRLVSLWLAPGSTVRFTSGALEALINDTLSAAADVARRLDQPRTRTVQTVTGACVGGFSP